MFLTKPLIIAHRGAHDGRTDLENRLPAFARAVELGVSTMECDIRLSADNEPVVIHDDTLDRTTRGSGPVNAFTAAELESYGVPTLRSLLRLLGERARLLVEIKSASPHRVAEVIFAESAQHRVTIFSFHPQYVRVMTRLHPRMEVGCIAGRWGEKSVDVPACLGLAVELGATSLLPYKGVATPELVEAAHARGLKVFPWTVNTPEDYKIMTDAGVDGILTDYPQAMLSMP